MKLKRIVSAALAGIMAFGLLIIPDVSNLNVSAADGDFTKNYFLRKRV